MLNQQTLNKLFVIRLNGMADAFRQQLEQTGLGGLSFEERFGMLVDPQWNWKEDRALSRRRRASRLKSTASVEDIDYQGSTRLGPLAAAQFNSGIGMGEEASERNPDRRNRSGEKLVGNRTGAQGLPRWLLERGCFGWPQATGTKSITMRPEELAMLVNGMDLSEAKPARDGTGGKRRP